nr:hypothetical protein [Propionicimonas sp.]
MTFPNGWDGPGYFAAQLYPEPVRTDWSGPVAKPGIVPPRPLQLGDILSGAFHAVRYAPSAMFGLTLVVLMVAQLLGTGVGFLLAKEFGGSIIPFDDVDLTDTALFSWSTVTGTLANSVTSVVVGMGLMYTVFHAVSARRVTPVEALRHMGRRMWAALGFSALAGLLMAGVVALGAAVLIPVFSSDNTDSGLVLVLLLAPFAAVLAAWLGTRTLFASCAIAVEGLGPLRAIARSWVLTRGMFWRLLGIYLVASVIISMAASTVSTVFSFAGGLLAMQDQTIGFVAMSTASTLTSTVLSLPLTTAVTTLLYVDARIRREGYDLQLSEALYG